MSTKKKPKKPKSKLNLSTAIKRLQREQEAQLELGSISQDAVEQLTNLFSVFCMVLDLVKISNHSFKVLENAFDALSDYVVDEMAAFRRKWEDQSRTVDLAVITLWYFTLVLTSI